MGLSKHANIKALDSLSIKTSRFFGLKKVAPSQIEAFAADNQDLSSLTNFGGSIHLFLNVDQMKNVLHSEPSAVSLLKLKAQTLASHPQARLEGIILGFGYQNVGPTELRKISSTLELVNGVMNREKKMKVSVAFPLAFLEKLGKDDSEEPRRLFSSIEKLAPMVIIEDNITSEPGNRDKVVRSVIHRALLSCSRFSPNHIPLVLPLKTPVFRSTAEAALLINSVLKSLESNAQIKPGRIVELYTDASDMHELRYQDVQYKRSVSFHRELLSHLKQSLHDLVASPTTTFPVTPVSPTPVITPDAPPTIITVPSTTPVTATPENPAAPIIVPPTNPVNPPVPITNPAGTPIAVPGAQPVSNPVTTYPSPPGGAPVTTPVTTPVTNPVAPPVTTNAPAVPGQSWCVARSGVSEIALQQALDYACGIGGADCSQIQEGANCYNPNSLQNHASYAFNSYYQKNPVPTSCDFGGVASIVNVNPSVGSCIYPTSQSSSTPATTTTTPTPTTASMSPPSTGVPISSSGTPPAVFNPVSAGPTGYTVGSPLAGNTSISTSTKLEPFRYSGCVVFLTTLVVAKMMLAK